MHELLKARPEVEELTPVHDAFVPVIKMQFGGVDIDLTFASLQLPTIAEDLELLDTNLLRNLDDASIRSVNGSRVTDEILRLVPNIPNFRLALRCIKLWAKRRAVYSNAMGFFGGVAWAMPVARVCQLYPNACAGTIVARFFRIMFNWKWPSPVLLKAIEDGPLQVRVWNPKLYAQDEAHKMPIITPAYPSMCATHNVSTSTKTIIMAEFKRGTEITDRIMTKKADWDELFEKSDFFYRYRHYLQVNVTSEDEDDHHRLHGLADARIRHYIMKLEMTEQIVLAHPYIKSFDHKFVATTDDEARKIRQGILPETDANSEGKAETKTKPEAEAETEQKKLFTSAFYIGLLIKERPANSNGKQRMDLSWATQEYIKLIKVPDLWKEESMSMTVRFLRGPQLPDEVFDGQPRSRKHRSSKRRQNDGAASDGQQSASEQQSKKSKVASATVPSTSGFNAPQNGAEKKPAPTAEASKAASNEASTSSPGAPKPDTEQDGAGSTVSRSGAAGAGTSVATSQKPLTSGLATLPTIAAPVPPATKTGGIKLKLAGSS
ncbi:polynucleotide adenylyltransferase [Linderina macrospora]|uniref:Polynucleotide adenylyltransferase n=1 Tax=Linderina macrospora TaxID=4868 RepID=A0ACC1J5S1_9FUNG|nr:polynucleotide adenylyltransferase [Linderina macrospora]